MIIPKFEPDMFGENAAKRAWERNWLRSDYFSTLPSKCPEV